MEREEQKASVVLSHSGSMKATKQQTSQEKEKFFFEAENSFLSSFHINIEINFENKIQS